MPMFMGMEHYCFFFIRKDGLVNTGYSPCVSGQMGIYCGFYQRTCGFNHKMGSDGAYHFSPMICGSSLLWWSQLTQAWGRLTPPGILHSLVIFAFVRLPYFRLEIDKNPLSTVDTRALHMYPGYCSKDSCEATISGYRWIHRQKR